MTARVHVAEMLDFFGLAGEGVFVALVVAIPVIAFFALLSLNDSEAAK